MIGRGPYGNRRSRCRVRMGKHEGSSRIEQIGKEGAPIGNTILRDPGQQMEDFL